MNKQNTVQPPNRLPKRCGSMVNRIGPLAVRAVSSLLLILAAGCATRVVLTPTVEGVAAPTCRIHAAVSYEGNPDYLPAVIIRDAESGNGVGLRYTYSTQYGIKEFAKELQLVNPLMIFGFPTGSDSAVMTGLLEVVHQGTVIRSYGAACAMKRAGTIFSEGETFTAMRRTGLLLVRNNVSAQICRDEPLLRELLAGEPPSFEEKK
jgi:hypothetical protein